jgi:hypothetical protein
MSCKQYMVMILELLHMPWGVLETSRLFDERVASFFEGHNRVS